eukprot:g13781.t1
MYLKGEVLNEKNYDKYLNNLETLVLKESEIGGTIPNWQFNKIKEIDLFENDLNGTIPPNFFLNNLQLYYFSVRNNLKLSGSLPYLPSNSSLRCLDIRGTNVSGGLSSTYLKIMNAVLRLPASGFTKSEIEDDIDKYKSTMTCRKTDDKRSIECTSYTDSEAEKADCSKQIPKNQV